MADAHVLLLTGTGLESTVRLGPDFHRRLNWQIQDSTGEPLHYLPHYGVRKGLTHMTLPPVSRGTRYQLVLVPREE